MFGMVLYKGVSHRAEFMGVEVRFDIINGMDWHLYM